MCLTLVGCGNEKETDTTIDKTSDQDPPGNRRKHTPHSVLTYKEKTQQIIYTSMQK